MVQCPPEIPPTINASNFVNHTEFIINFTNGALQGLPILSPSYETSDTVNYTNDFGALLSCNTGFRLDTVSVQSGLRQRAGTVYNNGTIDCGTLGSSNTIIFGGAFFAIYGTAAGISSKINATNVVNPGTINMGFDSLLTIQGDNVDITHGNLMMEATGFNIFNRTAFFNGGFFDGYWGLGTTNIFYPNGISPAGYYGANPPITPLHLVTNRNNTTMYQQLGGPSFAPYLLDVTDASGSNRTVRAVFLSNTNPAILAKVYFQSFFPYAIDPEYVEFSAVTTNAQAGHLTTNYLYLQDSFLTFTNFQLFIDGFAGVGFNHPTFIPENFSFFTGFQLALGTPAVSNQIPVGTFDIGLVTNQYTAYQAMFLPGSVVPGDVAGQVVTNEPGRIEVTADKVLALSQARINSGNYVLLRATNHFAGSAGAQNVAPNFDIYLRSTNGLLTLTNVLVPTAPTPLGVCDLYSARWTNVVNGATGTVTNRFHVLFVDLQLAPDSPVQVMNLNLWATNGVTHADDDSIVLSDIFNVTSNLLISTRRLTLTTNAQNSTAPAGVISYLNDGILWPTATPRLQYLTNNGGLQAKNLAVFGGSQSSPYSSPSSSVHPYTAFVNRGGVTNFGSTIFSTYFQNSGTFLANGGAIQLRQTQTAILTNGAFLAPGTAGAILIQGGSLLVSNHVLLAGQALTLNLTDYLDDGSLSAGADTVTNKNIWYAGYGINLPVLPSQSSLLATTITNVGPAGAIVYNTWAAQDRGPVPAGYATNAAVGQLILDGLDNRTVFWFQGANGSNALYVDLLQLMDATATNFDGAGNFAGVYLQPNLTVYYGGAVWNGKDISEQINGRYGIGGTSGGRFLWVSNYNTGFFSSTNVTYTDGTVHRLNRALVTSCDIDSNGNGVPNCMDADPVPVFSSSMLALKAVYTNGPARAVVVSWNTVPLASNFLYSCSSPLGATNQWQLVTNFLSGTTVGPRVTVTDMLKTNTVRYYRVRVVSP